MAALSSLRPTAKSGWLLSVGGGISGNGEGGGAGFLLAGCVQHVGSGSRLPAIWRRPSAPMGRLCCGGRWTRRQRPRGETKMNFTRWTAPPPSCGTAASVRCVEAAGRGLRVASPRLLTLFLPSGRPAVPRCAAGGCGGRGGPDGGGDGGRDVRAGGHHVRQVGVTGRRSPTAPLVGCSVSPTDASGSPRSCCVDEVAAEHVSAGAVVHYGPACLSPCRKLPVLHVFGRQPLDVGRCAEVFRELYPERQSRVVVLSDVVYAHAMGECCVAGRGSSGGAPRYYLPSFLLSPHPQSCLTNWCSRSILAFLSH